MAGRREGLLMRGNGPPSRGSRIAMAVAIGIILGCVFAFLFPDGLFRSSSPSPSRTQNSAMWSQVLSIRLHLLLFLFFMTSSHQNMEAWREKLNEIVNAPRLEIVVTYCIIVHMPTRCFLFFFQFIRIVLGILYQILLNFSFFFWGCSPFMSIFGMARY